MGPSCDKSSREFCIEAWCFFHSKVLARWICSLLTLCPLAVKSTCLFHKHGSQHFSLNFWLFYHWFALIWIEKQSYKPVNVHTQYQNRSFNTHCSSTQTAVDIKHLIRLIQDLKCNFVLSVVCTHRFSIISQQEKSCSLEVLLQNSNERSHSKAWRHSVWLSPLSLAGSTPAHLHPSSLIYPLSSVVK